MASQYDPAIFEPPPPSRRVFCNRTLNFRSIKAVGFDMDYTLIHYHIVEWERRAYEHARGLLIDKSWPLDDLRFDPDMTSRGLVLDTELGNIVKADRFGYVKRASHGTSMLSWEDQRRVYGPQVHVDLNDSRWIFLNTLFALSASCLYAQCVDLLDDGRIEGRLGYRDLRRVIQDTVDEAHMMGKLKGEVIASPERFVESDPELPQALLDLKDSGKKLLLITNSEWAYTQSMMSYAFDSYLPQGLDGWRDLFDIVIVSARKPHFFSSRSPIFEVVDEAGLLRPVVGGALRKDGIYLGGDAATVESHLGLSGAELLYVGDHIVADVSASKSLKRWRTALVLRELEAELEAEEAFRQAQNELETLMAEKERLERGSTQLRLKLLRLERGSRRARRTSKASKLREQIHSLRAELEALDERIGPLARKSSELVNRRWGAIMRTGNDKSHLARQIERFADIYTSRVSNLGLITPFGYLRAPRSSLPHDCNIGGS
jgi:HAD superfamily 5'-nucleotidase-like hydrolase